MPLQRVSAWNICIAQVSLQTVFIFLNANCTIPQISFSFHINFTFENMLLSLKVCEWITPMFAELIAVLFVLQK